MEQSIRKLALGRVDYIVSNPWIMKSLPIKLKKQKLIAEHKNFVTVGEIIDQNALYILFSKKSNKYKDFGNEMSTYIKELKATGKMDQIINHSFSLSKEWFSHQQ